MEREDDFRVEALRERMKPFNVAELARQVGVTDITLYNFRKGKHVLKSDSLLKLCDVMNVSLSELENPRKGAK